MLGIRDYHLSQLFRSVVEIWDLCSCDLNFSKVLSEHCELYFDCHHLVYDECLGAPRVLAWTFGCEVAATAKGSIVKEYS